MHYGRILAVLGVIVSVIGFVMKKASSAGEEFMPALNQATGGAVPSGLDENTWSALYNDTAIAAIVFGLALLAVLAIAFMPPLKEAMNRTYALSATVIGVVMLVIGIFSLRGANSDASDLEGAFGLAAQGGQLPDAYTVSVGMGWYLLILGGALVAIGGVLSMMARSGSMEAA